MRLAVCRIVGNELPPRDTPGSRIDCLNWMLDIDRSPLVQYVYVINHILDPDYREQIIETLKDQTTIEMPFDPSIYGQCPDKQSRIRYAININEARNYGIRFCQQSADFVACLDQDCYFESQEVKRVIRNIEHDQVMAPYRRHYGVITKRCHITAIPEDFAQLPDAEPMVIVRNDATRLFDPALAFGDSDKIELLEFMGYTVSGCSIQRHGENARTAGTCIHMSFGDEKAENDIHYRGDIRTQSLKRMLVKIDELYPHLKLDT